MGVKHLWEILDPVKKKEDLECLRGKTLCVDLSHWICEAECTAPLKNAVLNPYLRNLFFRVLCLQRLGAHLIFVLEGKAPELKWETIVNRNQNGPGRGRGRGARGRGRGPKSKSNDASQNVALPLGRGKPVGRSRFQRKIKECSVMLGLLGIPCVQSAGEAEAMCALINKEGIADGCLTEDGDTFLYGARVIYKDLGISSKDPHVYSYNMEDIESRLNINRRNMVALALLWGCDYSHGVPSVGKDTALKLLKALQRQGEDTLERFKKWRSEDFAGSTSSSIEKIAYRRAMKVKGFPNQEVIDEFLIPKDDLSDIRSVLKWEYPDLKGLQEFCLKRMEWPEEYTASKVLSLSTSHYLERRSQRIISGTPIRPVRLIKTRTQHGVPLCEIEWQTKLKESTGRLWQGYPDEFTTLESQQEIMTTYPNLVDDFLEAKASKSKKKKGKSKKQKPKEASYLIEETEAVQPIGQKDDDMVEDSQPTNASNYVKENISLKENPLLISVDDLGDSLACLEISNLGDLSLEKDIAHSGISTNTENYSIYSSETVPAFVSSNSNSVAVSSTVKSSCNDSSSDEDDHALIIDMPSLAERLKMKNLKINLHEAALYDPNINKTDNHVCIDHQGNSNGADNHGILVNRDKCIYVETPKNDKGSYASLYYVDQTTKPLELSINLNTNNKPVLESAASFLEYNDISVLSINSDIASSNHLQELGEKNSVSDTADQNEPSNINPVLDLEMVSGMPKPETLKNHLDCGDIELSKKHDDESSSNMHHLDQIDRSFELSSNANSCISLFDSPTSSVDYNSSSMNITPSQEEYVQKLRDKFQLIVTSTPSLENKCSKPDSSAIASYSPTASYSPMEDNKENSPLNYAPLSLAERLRKKLYTTPNILKTSNK